MTITRVIAVAACGLALASCSSLSLNMPSFESEDVSLTIDSAPPGAQARASNGGVCRTPCTLSLTGTDDFTVTYMLDGYVPQTVPVRSIQPLRSAMIDLTPPRFEPNPVFAQLEPAPPPPPPNPPPVKRRQRPQTTLPAPPPPSMPFPPLPFPPGFESR